MTSETEAFVRKNGERWAADLIDGLRRDNQLTYAENERLGDELAAAHDQLATVVVREVRPLQSAITYAIEILETQPWWHDPSHDLYPLRFVLKDVIGERTEPLCTDT